jgi:hypothetical protein
VLRPPVPVNGKGISIHEKKAGRTFSTFEKKGRAMCPAKTLAETRLTDIYRNLCKNITTSHFSHNGISSNLVKSHFGSCHVLW